MPQLSEVALTNSRIDDDGIEELCSNTKIWRLEIGGTKITDKGLAFLSRLEKLTYLDLSDTSITDSGAKFLGELSGLEYLNLNGTEIGNSINANSPGLREGLPSTDDGAAIELPNP